MVPTAVETRIRRVLLRYVGEQRMPLSVPQVHELARIAARAAETGRPKEIQQPGRPKANQVEGLEQPHLVVLRLIARFMTNAEIAAHLDLSKHQVEHRVRRLYSALGTSTRSGLVAAARDAGLLGPVAASEGVSGAGVGPGAPEGSEAPQGAPEGFGGAR